jgi:serine/threonine protein kinase
MSRIVRLNATDGSKVEFDEDKLAGSGGLKDVYFSPDKSYVVGWYRDKVDANGQDRLKNIVTNYRQSIFEREGGDYWKDLFCWPTNLVMDKGRTGVVMPTYHSRFFFAHGSKNGDMLGIKGKDKEGFWFASAHHQQKFLDPRERGDWLKYLSLCIKIARATKRLHAAGLAHSDLSYKNVLIDPGSGGACIIDLDGLVVPNKYPPDVVGTPDFIAPEVLSTLKLPLTDKARKLPSRETDQHSLAVLVYMYLLYRHPLKGGIVHPASSEEERLELEMGSKALFIEHPSDRRNRPNIGEVRPSSLPFADVTKIPHSVAGPYLKALFDRAFIDGLHAPHLRPIADEWENALVKTVDLVQPCKNPACDQKWYVFDNTTKPSCPFCGTPFHGQLPVLNLYSSDGKGKFRPDNHRLMVYDQQNLYPWHANRRMVPNEKLTDAQRKPVADFHFRNGGWMLVNRSLPHMKNATTGAMVPPGTAIALTDGLQLLLSPEDGGRLIHVQLVQA